MAKQAKKDDLLTQLGLDMDHIKARLAELKTAGAKLTAEAKKDLDKSVKAFESKHKDLEVKMGEWAKTGKAAGADIAEGLKRAAKELKAAVEEAATHLKK